MKLMIRLFISIRRRNYLFLMRKEFCLIAFVEALTVGLGVSNFGRFVIVEFDIVMFIIAEVCFEIMVVLKLNFEIFRITCLRIFGNHLVTGVCYLVR